ncbi:MAG: ribosomal protein S18-alanine N-acetyltransferase [Anaerolineae bacterium]|nr:ribosomal protein S18-alanine N-acetyltransferase [Anaerolineae bacterium]
MAVSDLGDVMAIERLSFSSPWSEQAYRFEIEKNKNSLMLVVRPAFPLSLWDRIRGRAGVSSPVLGYAGLWLLVDEAHISTIAVHPRWRGRGLGELLLLSLLEQAARRGMQRATLEVRVSNEAAQGLYHKLGFETAGRQKRYYSDNNEDAFIMVTPLFDAPGFHDNLRRRRAELLARFQAGAAQLRAYRLDSPPQLG